MPEELIELAKRKLERIKEGEIVGLPGLRGAFELCKKGKKKQEFCIELLGNIERYEDALNSGTPGVSELKSASNLYRKYILD